jgi:galactokinase
VTRFSLKDLADPSFVASLLLRAGMHQDGAGAKAAIFADSARNLLQIGLEAKSPAMAFFIPGRIEVLGKHTDYNGGSSILAAAELGFCLVAVPREDAMVRILAGNLGETAQFAMDPNLAPTIGHWSNYPMTAARRIARNFPESLRGADVAFASDLPMAAGMSSSSAMIVSSFLVLATVNALDQRSAYRQNIDSKEALAGYLGTVENGQSFATLAGDKGVGTFGGSEDHTAMLCCTADTLAQYAYCPVKFQRRLPLPPDYVFAVASSGVVAEKTGQAREKYNRASLLCSAAIKAWRDATGSGEIHLKAAIASAPGAAGRMREILRHAKATRHGDAQFTPNDLLTRFEHFYAENEEIIPAAGNALAKGDMQAFGRQVDRSQELTDTLLGNQVPETIFLARAARELGAAAASAFGAGFGGSVWSLITKDKAQALVDNWRQAYRKKFPNHAANAEFFITRAGPGAFELQT